MLESFHRGPLPPAQSYVSDGGGQVLVTAVKFAEDSGASPDLIVRAVETTGHPARASIEVPMLGRTLHADFAPHRIRTFRLPSAGGPVRETDLIEWELPDVQVSSTPLPVAPAGGRDAEPDHDASDATLPAERMAPAQRRHPDS
ncbi:hypothetical protein ACQP2F_31315 [Actinoplanes sp. CA-030573]|uniref:hypothetical protein n=1 Tax=Actinoplanes sp. CA-030573 TaxID=3239898 RepID=UPI003D923B30